ncbi:MAG: aldehyde dehydrogenase family protein [Chloroflexi bacterium]|nr:aldehyde dehydrogenase family protein [Chloroflexota bacterium]
MSATFDKDLQSIQEARRLAVACRNAQREFAHFSQEETDRVVAAMADAGYRAAERLGVMAHDETGYGVPSHKKLKNEFASRTVWESIRDVKTAGVIRRDDARGIVEIGWPVGVIVGLTPSTNPTSTILYKSLISLKARNGIVFAPHPSAVKCSLETTRIMAEAAQRAGAPAGLIACMSKISLPGTHELMGHWAVNLILATGGAAMVRAAHSAGKPAYGVGPGNVPVYVDRSADIPQAAFDIVNSKSFDCSVICSSEQAVVADRPIAAQLRREMERHGAYFVDQARADALGRRLFRPDGTNWPEVVGKTPQQLAEMSGIQVPGDARVLVADLNAVGPEHPLSREKLTTVLGFYEEEGWIKGCERCIELLKFGGDGHTLAIHAQDEEVIMAFGLEKPAFRIVVNTAATAGAIGLTTDLDPAMTLATGGMGGGISSDNITVRHLLNTKRLAYGRRPWPLKAEAEPRPQPTRPAPVATGGYSEAEVEAIVRRVVQELRGSR